MGIQRESRGRREENLKESAVIGGPALLLLVVGFAVAYLFVEPAPPDRIEIAAGARGGAYFAFAERYRDIVAAQGVELVVRETSGSIENLGLLDDPTSDVQIAFVQGGTGDPTESPDLMSLASLYYEPIWLFHRAGDSIERLSDLNGKTIAIGADGSGTQPVARMLLRENGVADGTKHLSIGGWAAVDALRQGVVDATFIVASPEADFVNALLADDAVQAMNFRRAAAYSHRHRFLSEVTLPQGVVDLARDIPPADITLVAATATLVARKDFHPALVALLLQTAQQVHRDGGMLEGVDRFPSGRHVDFPLSEDARRYLKSGQNFLQRYLPFWVANFLDRTKVMLVPLLTLLYPLFRMLPPVYRWRMRSKVARCYQDLSRLEGDLRGMAAGDDIATFTAELDRIEDVVRELHVSRGYLDSVYALRLHIEMVRAEVARSAGGTAPRGAGTTPVKADRSTDPRVIPPP
ncbi:MAG: ABC transporter substrate-binding protein [Rhodospirillales bacterium]|nr:MAG: ABC transporter substrate-binding protein [Rhodospirillales bacterium]